MHGRELVEHYIKSSKELAEFPEKQEEALKYIDALEAWKTYAKNLRDAAKPLVCAAELAKAALERAAPQLKGILVVLDVEIAVSELDTTIASCRKAAE